MSNPKKQEKITMSYTDCTVLEALQKKSDRMHSCEQKEYINMAISEIKRLQAKIEVLRLPGSDVLQMKADVIPICGAEWPCSQILECANEKTFQDVLVIGWLEQPDEGKRFWLSSNLASDSEVIYALTMALSFVIKRCEENNN